MKSKEYYYQQEFEKYDLNYEIHRLSQKPEERNQTLLSKIYGYVLLIVFAISVSMLDSISLIPTIVLAITIILGTVYLYLGGHLNG